MYDFLLSCAQRTSMVSNIFVYITSSSLQRVLKLTNPGSLKLPIDFTQPSTENQGEPLHKSSAQDRNFRTINPSIGVGGARSKGTQNHILNQHRCLLGQILFILKIYTPDLVSRDFLILVWMHKYRTEIWIIIYRDEFNHISNYEKTES